MTLEEIKAKRETIDDATIIDETWSVVEHREPYHRSEYYARLGRLGSFGPMRAEDASFIALAPAMIDDLIAHVERANEVAAFYTGKFSQSQAELLAVKENLRTTEAAFDASRKSTGDNELLLVGEIEKLRAELNDRRQSLDLLVNNAARAMDVLFRNCVMNGDECYTMAMDLRGALVFYRSGMQCKCWATGEYVWQEHCVLHPVKWPLCYSLQELQAIADNAKKGIFPATQRGEAAK